MAKIVSFTTSDLVFDQRVQRAAKTLSNAGHQVTLIGRRLKRTPLTLENDFKGHFFSMIFSKGLLFYKAYNFRALCYILFNPCDLVISNDLDTLPGCRLGSMIKRVPLIYDNHELFTEVPELVDRPLTRWVWEVIEKVFIAGATHITTVSDGIAAELKNKYGVTARVIRNLPTKKNTGYFKSHQPKILYQGALNKGRGLEIAIDMMNILNCYKLIIVGSGDLEIPLRMRVVEQKLFDRVEFRGMLLPHELHDLACTAWLGISLEEDMGKSYHNALPNKLFDYVQAHVPVLVSDLPEMRKLVEEHSIGMVAEAYDPGQIARQISDFFEDKVRRKEAIRNARKAADILIWEKEEHLLLEVVDSALGLRRASNP